MSDAREYPSRPYSAVGGIVRKRDTVLVIRRGRPPLGGEWSVPGGAVELGETMREAVAREVREECGIEIAVGEVVDTIDVIVRDPDGRVLYHYAIVDYGAEWVSGELRAASDVTAAGWVSRDELENLTLNARTREILVKGMGW